jgi:hypothetical protein
MVPVPIPDMPDSAGVGVARRPETASALPIPESLARVWRIVKTRQCLHCGSIIGYRAALGALYCSDSHQNADLDYIQQFMVTRLEQSRARLVAFQRLQSAPCQEEVQS